MNTLYITGAGVSAESGIPTFRGEDGFWTIGSVNYTPEQMATRHMYENDPVEFLSWYFHRFATYRNHGPNEVHYWLADKNLITQNIDGLDGKAGNKDYISIHGRLDQMTLYHTQGESVETMTTPWDRLNGLSSEDEGVSPALSSALLDLFNIDQASKKPELNASFKPYVLLFDEFYTELYRINEAQERMVAADRIIFMGTSFSVNITQIALEVAVKMNKPIEVVDPMPVKIAYDNVTYHEMKAIEYIHSC